MYEETLYKKKAFKKAIPVYCRDNRKYSLLFNKGWFVWGRYKSIKEAAQALKDLRRSNIYLEFSLTKKEN